MMKWPANSLILDNEIASMMKQIVREVVVSEIRGRENNDNSNCYYYDN